MKTFFTKLLTRWIEEEDTLEDKNDFLEHLKDKVKTKNVVKRIDTETYNKLVEETALVIREIWDKKINAEQYLDIEDAYEVEAKNVFFIREDLILISKRDFVINPKTKDWCLKQPFKFSSEKMIDKYIRDVLMLLPDETVYTEEEGYEYERRDGESIEIAVNRYSFSLRIDIK